MQLEYELRDPISKFQYFINNNDCLDKSEGAGNSYAILRHDFGSEIINKYHIWLYLDRKSNQYYSEVINRKLDFLAIN